MDANKKEGKKGECQQHPVFPGGHPSKYWRGSMLLNFGDRTRTGAFSMIWPLTRKVRADQRFHSFSHSKYFLETRDGAGSHSQSWWRWQWGIFPIDLCFHPRSMLTFLQNAVSKSWSPVAMSGLEVFCLKISRASNCFGMAHENVSQTNEFINLYLKPSAHIA